jgi:hypothetical protein
MHDAMPIGSGAIVKVGFERFSSYHLLPWQHGSGTAVATQVSNTFQNKIKRVPQFSIWIDG